jgi:hypothetical protein
MLVGKPDAKRPPGLPRPKCGNTIYIIPQERGQVCVWSGLMSFRIKPVAVSCENSYKPSDATKCHDILAWVYFHFHMSSWCAQGELYLYLYWETALLSMKIMLHWFIFSVLTFLGIKPENRRLWADFGLYSSNLTLWVLMSYIYIYIYMYIYIYIWSTSSCCF